MNTDKIASLLENIEHEVPEEGGIVRQDKIYKFSTTVIKGDQIGLIKFGTECIRQAISSESKENLKLSEFENDKLKEINGDYFDSFAFHRWDELKKEEKPEMNKDTKSQKTPISIRLFLYSFTAVVVLVGVVGTYTTATWIISKF